MAHLIVCAQNPAASSKDLKVLFAFEGPRAITSVVGKAIAAIALVRQDGSSVRRRDIEDFVASWSVVPLLSSGPPSFGGDAAGGGSGRAADGGSTSSGGAGAGAGAVVETLSQPMRITISAKTGLIYIADTGNHRVLELDKSGVVKRVFGARDGTSGPAVPGCTADKLRFNRPMGLYASFDGSYLYVADCGNDAIRKLLLGLTS